MIRKELVNPKSIAVIGASNEITKPGGKVLRNILDGKFAGDLYAVNPKEEIVQGIKCYKSPDNLPLNVDLAIISIPSKFVPQTVKILAENCSTRAFIVLSAGFSETGDRGAALEKELLEIVDSYDATLIGPNCMGILTTSYQGTFAGPIPSLKTDGVDFASGSGATAAFIMEAGIDMGLTFSSMFSVGNSAQTGVEDILAFWDETYDPATCSPVKLLYMEKIDKPQMFLKHASSLIKKGCRLAAIKAGASDAGNRAASSHTGAMASSDAAVDALFSKAGVVRCYGREDLMLSAALFSHRELKGNSIAIVTHAGGPGVMLADTLSKAGFIIPELKGPAAEKLLSQLYPGSSISNPIDFLATGTAEHLEIIIDTIDNDFPEIDGIVVIFGTPGLMDVTPVYKVLDEKMKNCSKPIYPVLPSVVTAKDAVQYFKSLGRSNFSDEVLLGQTMGNIVKRKEPADTDPELPEINVAAIRKIVDESSDGYLSSTNALALIDAAGIPHAKEITVNSIDELKSASGIGYPLALKVSGVLHKSDSNGVSLNISDENQLLSEFNRLMDIQGANGVLVQEMLSGTELFAGVSRHDGYGHLMMFGMGGIFIEVFKDVVSALAPLGHEEAGFLLKKLRSYPLFRGVRGQKGLDEEKFLDIIIRISALLKAAPEIEEMDLNPVLGTYHSMACVDWRISLKR
ncbi:MAG: acetate--CoA ligase family protein [Deltaproteobacteria bacterium]|nr:acetate--CoA ligase family protein [Deltaproteobacteria bacterium]